jgi:hypothetical protein
MFYKQQDEQSDNPTEADALAADKLAASVQRWGMSAPATIVLAMGRPLGFFGAQLLYVGGPMLRLLDFALGSKLATRADALAHLLENPVAMERLNARIEQGAAAPSLHTLDEKEVAISKHPVEGEE